MVARELDRAVPQKRNPAWNDVERGQPPSEARVWVAPIEQIDLTVHPARMVARGKAMDEPCMHLTVTLLTLKGVDLLNWAVERLRSEPEVRTNLPVMASPQARAPCAEALMAHLSEIRKEDIIGR